jgi:hypothetical protein
MHQEVDIDTGALTLTKIAACRRNISFAGVLKADAIRFNGIKVSKVIDYSTARPSRKTTALDPVPLLI